MNIGDAVSELKAGRELARAGWNGRGMSVYLQEGSPDGVYLPFVMMRTVKGAVVPWLCSQTDLLADDWELVTEPTG